MALPEPEPGLVIAYAYLWADEAELGAEEGRKTRPCAIVLARQIVGDERAVTVVPITHSTPADPQTAVEIPSGVKRHLGLDAERSWALVSEVNTFIWPGPDLAPVSRAAPDRYAYGVLPPKLFRTIRDRLIALAEARRTRSVTRTR